ncbi:uncharacterized protein PRCAT00000042001 [Priceomyces carsonii]|uniref:uncharacterized protein n=1 Tax=Priceomyces carsonii TaxID=28549 RepID=UPI002ED903C3|nr:unnamed protein product [Priceomyces carsonii]
MNSLYNHGIKQQQLITKDLSQFEKNLSTSPLSLQGSITTSLTAFKRTVKEFSDLVEQSKRDENNGKQEIRAAKFNQDLIDFTEKFESLKRQRDALVHTSNRQELMGRRHHSSQNDNSIASDNPFDQQQSQEQAQQYMSYEEGLYNEKQSLSRGTQQLDHILEMGQQAFEDIVDQNETLRRLQVRFEESLVTLGVSQSTIRSIEKRAKQDRWLFWGGILLMFTCFWFILKLFR